MCVRAVASEHSARAQTVRPDPGPRQRGNVVQPTERPARRRALRHLRVGGHLRLRPHQRLGLARGATRPRHPAGVARRRRPLPGQVQG